MNTTDRTPVDLLRSALAGDAGRPLVTWYDDTTGERVELSVTTLANWVAKTANLLRDDLGAEPGDRLALLLPAHWQTAAWLLACASARVVPVIGGDPGDADLVVAGPDRLEEARECRGERVALSLRPLGARFPEPPEGFIDYAVAVPGQGDVFVPDEELEPGDEALVIDGIGWTADQVVEDARIEAAEMGLAPGDRVLCRLEWNHRRGLFAGFWAPLAVGGSVVICRPGAPIDDATLERRRETERVTRTVE
ncbi:TIGR03089 family protein [Streptomyces alkaliphilus]|uniref:TIGR03089 family protein n=1 Tax=Streptomyces alkaliphilus TaxID=1472722 RepID=UPI0011816D28|nr:TIGR03089 family protein [Streptomyces alkaliphilus]MQS07786.1 TIGR03089 family protein [Streptomyces alkaliphilus]